MDIFKFNLLEVMNNCCNEFIKKVMQYRGVILLLFTKRRLKP